MRIIDEKGRLFGKINVIDFLVILFLISLTPMFYFGYKISNKKATEIKAQEQRQGPKEEFIIMINCKFIKLKPEVSKMISVGDKERDSDGNLIGEIVSLGELSPYIYKFDVGPSQELMRKDPNLKEVAVTLKINPAVRDKNIYYKDKKILQGGTLEFSTGKYSAETEGIAIVKDNYNAVIDKAVQNSSAEDEKLDTIKKEFGLQLSILEKRLDSSLEQLTNKINELENKINLSKPIVEKKSSDKEIQ